MTVEQQLASDPSSSAWVAASAGTGKTKVLTDRVLRLLLTGTPPERILCLTFTKAAATEMRDRLSERLGGWCLMDDATLRREIELLTSDAAPDALLSLARRLFAVVLEQPSKIQTIHSFCQSLLGRFPLEAAIPPHFTLIDERSAQELMFEARERALAAARSLGNATLSAAMQEVTSYVAEEEFSELMDDLASERGALMRLFRRHGGVDGVVGEIRRVLSVGPAETIASVTRDASLDSAFDHVGLRSVAAIMQIAKKTDRENGQKIAEWLASSCREDGFEAYCTAYFTATGKLRAKLCHEDTEKGFPGAGEILVQEADRLVQVRARLNAVRVASATAALLRLGEQIIAEYERSKAFRAVLDFDDLVLKVCDLLTAQDAASWVLYKLDNGIDHILIDEAQDTNPEQWTVVGALADEFFAGGSPFRARTVFAVGDIKQSIYSFQRADPAGFDRMRTRFKDQGDAIGQAVHQIALNVSFRSTDAVLSAVDAVFARPEAADGVVSDGKAIQHVPHRRGCAGRVEVWPLVEATPAEDPESWVAPVEYRYHESSETRLAKTIAGQIKCWLSSGEPLDSQGRAIRASDVLVLVRRRTPFVETLVRALKDLGVPVAGADRMVLTEQIAVMDMLALGRFLLLQSDDLSLACLLKSPLFSVAEDDLFSLCHGRNGSVWGAMLDAMSLPASIAAAREELCSLLDWSQGRRPFEIFTHVLSFSGGRQRMLARLGPDAADPLDELLNLALDFERQHAPSLQGFLQWMDSGKAEIKRDFDQKSRDEVRIMTVHGAKGLQAPIVFLADTVQTPQKVPALLWPVRDGVPLWSPRRDTDDPVSQAARDLAVCERDREYRRLLYVAMTRPEDRLYVCGAKGSRDLSDVCWYSLIATGLRPIAVTTAVDLSAVSPSGWSGDAMILQSRQTADITHKSVRSALVLRADIPDFVARPAPAEPVPASPLVPSRMLGYEPAVRSPFDQGDPLRFVRGKITHRLFELLPLVPPADREEACVQFLSRDHGGLPETLRAEITSEVLRVMQDPNFERLFGPDSQAEVPVVGSVCGHIISGQLDRLYVGSEDVLVVDFKTNRVAPAAAEDVAPLYIAQMACYRDLLGEIYKRRKIVCALLWTSTSDMMVLPDRLLDQYSPVQRQPISASPASCDDTVHSPERGPYHVPR